MVDEFEESPSRDKQAKFKVQILNTSNSASASHDASPVHAQPTSDRNDRSSIFEVYERKHGNGVDIHSSQEASPTARATSRPPSRPPNRVSSGPERNDKSSIFTAYEQSHSHVSASEDDRDNHSRPTSRNGAITEERNSVLLTATQSRERVSGGAERTYTDSGVAPIIDAESSPNDDQRRQREITRIDDDRRERGDVLQDEERLAAQARSALERQKSGRPLESKRSHPGNTEDSRRISDRERRQAQIDEERHRQQRQTQIDRDRHRAVNRNAMTTEAASRAITKATERGHHRGSNNMSPSTSYESGYYDHYDDERSRRSDHSRRASFEYDYDYEDEYDHRRRPPSGYKGNYKGKNFNPQIAAQGLPPRKRNDDRPRRSSRDMDYDYTRKSPQYPPARLERHVLPSKPAATFSPTFSHSSIPQLRQDTPEEEKSDLFVVPDPTRPPIKAEGKQNFLRFEDGTIRCDGEGLFKPPSDPRKNKRVFWECIKHENNRHRYANNVVFLKSFRHDKHSLQPPPTNCICIKGIPSALTEKDLNTYFKGKYNTFNKMTLQYDRSTGVSLGLLWINFSKHYDAETCIQELNGVKNFNLGKGHIGSVPPIQVRPDDDGRSVFKRVIDDFYKKREEDNKRARREREEEKKKKDSAPKAAAIQVPKSLPTPSTKIGFNPNQQTPSRPGVGGKTSWLSSASKPSTLAHTPSHPKPLEMPKAGSEDTEDEDEWDDLHGDEIFRGRSDNMLTRKKDSPVKKSQHDPDAMEQDGREAEMSIDEKIKKNGNAHVFIDKSSLPVHSVDVVDVRAFFGQFKVSDVLKSDDGWFVLFAKPGIAGRAITTADGRQCSGFTMHLQLRDPEAQQLESHNDISKETVKLSDKRPMSEESQEESYAVPEQPVKSKRGRVVKSKNRRLIDFTSSEGESDDEKQAAAAVEKIGKKDTGLAKSGPGDKRDTEARVNAKVEDAVEIDLSHAAEKTIDMVKIESEQTASTEYVFDTLPETKLKSKRPAKPKKASAPKRKTNKATKKASKNAPKSQSPAKSEASAVSDISEEPDIHLLMYTPKEAKPAPPEVAPDFEPISDPSSQYTKSNILSSDLVTSEEDLYYLKTVFDRQARKLPTNIQTLLQCHNYTPPDWKDDLRFSIFNSPEKTDKNAPWRPPVHATGSARSEGLYPIPETEKAFYLPQRNKVTKASRQHEDEKNVSSRANRSNARSLVHGLTGGATDGEILKFNQLRTRKKELRFAKSSIHSWGLYSCQVIPKGEMVIEYVGEVVRQQVADRREKAYEKQGIGSSYLFKIDDDNIVDATMKGSVARLINHCCQPNCTAKIITILGEKKIIIYAKTEISPGDEITYDYHFPIEDEKIPCLCGVDGCRGSLN